MDDTATRIAAGLERAFAARGFAQPSVDDLRDAAGVSLRTLYKYVPSREAMVLVALEHRHERYTSYLFSALPDAADRMLALLLERQAAWMEKEASHGCLFHAAVAAAPHDRALRAMLERHKTEVAARVVRLAGLDADREADVMVIFEGLTQSWPLSGDAALVAAKRLAATL